MVKNRKGLLFLIFALLAIYIIVSIILIIPKGKKYDSTIFIGDSTKIKIVDNKMTIYNEDVEIKRQKVKILFNGTVRDAYISSTASESDGVKNGYIIYSEDGKLLTLNSTLIAYTDNLSPKFIDSENHRSDEINEIKGILDINNIDTKYDFQLGYLDISTFDLDNDGVYENIYSIGLIPGEESSSNKYYSFVYFKKGDKLILIDKIESEYNEIKSVRLSFFKLVDFNNDGNYEFIISKMMSEYGPEYFELYNFDGTKFTKIGEE